jgi:hypothetical protein
MDAYSFSDHQHRIFHEYFIISKYKSNIIFLPIFIIMYFMFFIELCLVGLGRMFAFGRAR